MIKTSVAVAEFIAENAPVPLRGPFRKSIGIAAKIGYHAVELHVNKPSELDINDLMESLARYNMKVSSIATGGAYLIDHISLSNKDESKRLQSVQRMKQQIDLAERLGCSPKVIIGVIKGLLADGVSREEYIDNYTRSLKECIAYAEQKGVLIVMESANKTESDIFNTINECVPFIKEFKSPNFKLHIDSYHMQLEEKNMYRDIIGAGDIIAHVHISDSCRMPPDGKHFDFPLMMDALKKIHYGEYLALECKKIPGEYEAAKKGYDYIQTLF